MLGNNRPTSETPLKSSSTKKRSQSWTPSEKTFWIRACTITKQQPPYPGDVTHLELHFSTLMTQGINGLTHFSEVGQSVFAERYFFFILLKFLEEILLANSGGLDNAFCLHFLYKSHKSHLTYTGKYDLKS